MRPEGNRIRRSRSFRETSFLILDCGGTFPVDLPTDHSIWSEEVSDKLGRLLKAYGEAPFRWSQYRRASLTHGHVRDISRKKQKLRV